MVKMHPSNLAGLRKPGNLLGAPRCLGERSVAEFQTSIQPQSNLQTPLNGLLIADRFRIIGETPIGSGSGGEVWEAIDLKTNQRIALKRINKDRVKEKARESAISSDDTISSNPLLVAPLTAISDFRFHETLFISTALRKEGDLRNLLHYHGPFRLKNARSAMADILITLDFLHSSKRILHRDVKPENLYWDGTTCRLGDFGLARPINHLGEKLTPQMITLWYRAPEILLGSQLYNSKVDIFSAGAVFGELLLGKPLFKGHSEIDQIKLIFDLLGFPISNQEGWPSDIACTLGSFAVIESPGGGGDKIHKDRWVRLADKMPFGTPVSALDFMVKLMSVNPLHRPSARDALLHPFFWEEPKVALWRTTSAATTMFKEVAPYKPRSEANAAEEQNDAKKFDEDELPPVSPPLFATESSGDTMKDTAQTSDSPIPLLALNLNSKFNSQLRVTSKLAFSSSSSASFSKLPSSNIPMEKSNLLSKKPRTKLGAKIRRHPAHLRPYAVLPSKKMRQAQKDVQELVVS